jgi:hypothetical protein
MLISIWIRTALADKSVILLYVASVCRSIAKIAAMQELFALFELTLKSNDWSREPTELVQLFHL